MILQQQQAFLLVQAEIVDEQGRRHTVPVQGNPNESPAEQIVGPLLNHPLKTFSESSNETAGS